MAGQTTADCICANHEVKLGTRQAITRARLCRRYRFHKRGAAGAVDNLPPTPEDIEDDAHGYGYMNDAVEVVDNNRGQRGLAWAKSSNVSHGVECCRLRMV